MDKQPLTVLLGQPWLFLTLRGVELIQAEKGILQ